MENTNHEHVPEEKYIDDVAERPTTNAERPGSHAAWLRSRSDEQLRLVVQVLSRHQGLYRI